MPQPMARHTAQYGIDLSRETRPPSHQHYLDKHYLDKHYLDPRCLDQQYLDPQYLDQHYLDNTTYGVPFFSPVLLWKYLPTPLP